MLYSDLIRQETEYTYSANDKKEGDILVGDKYFPIELLDPAKNKNIDGVNINRLLNNNENGIILLYSIHKHF